MPDALSEASVVWIRNTRTARPITGASSPRGSTLIACQAQLFRLLDRNLVAARGGLEEQLVPDPEQDEEAGGAHQRPVAAQSSGQNRIHLHSITNSAPLSVPTRVEARRMLW